MSTQVRIRWNDMGILPFYATGIIKLTFGLS
jgi:hypothetical protein